MFSDLVPVQLHKQTNSGRAHMYHDDCIYYIMAIPVFCRNKHKQKLKCMQ
jgi:hypothetical protein